MIKKPLNKDLIRNYGSPIDIDFINKMFPIKEEDRCVKCDLKWEGDRIVFVPNENGRYKVYYGRMS